MSGLVAIWERGGWTGAASPEIVRAMLGALPAGHCRPSRVHRQANVCLGVLAELDASGGEPRFPLAVDPVSGIAIAMDGRLDDPLSIEAAIDPEDRRRLGAAADSTAEPGRRPGALGGADDPPGRVGLSGPPGRVARDARLLLAGYLRWGDGVFERWLGPLAAVVFDPSRGCITAARDALGDRTVSFADTAGRLIMASSEAALVVHPMVDDSVDRDSMERFFALQGPRRGHTFFSAVRELPPAHAARFEARGHAEWRHWSPPTAIDPVRRSDEAWAADFLAALDTAVRARLPSSGPTALMLSGGIDSSTVAGIAARALSGGGRSIRAYSYIFDEIERCDERRAIQATSRYLAIEPRFIVADRAAPYSDLDAWPHDAAQPMRPVQDRLTIEVMRAAEADGVSVMLAGTFGDHLFSGSGDWLADLLREGRLTEAARELALHVRSAGPVATLGSASVRRLFGTLRQRLAPASRSRSRRDPSAIDSVWLVPEVAARQRSAGGSATEAAGGVAWPRPGQRAAVLGDDVAWTAAREAHTAAGFGVDLRLPYRDRRVVELALRMPAHQLYNRGQAKHVLRNAARGLVPDATARPGVKPSLGPLFDAGRRQADREAIRALLFRDGALWRGIVDEAWLARVVELRLGPSARAVADLSDLACDWLLWRCVAGERWSDSRRAGSPAPAGDPIELADTRSLGYAGRVVESGPETLDRLWRFC